MRADGSYVQDVVSDDAEPHCHEDFRTLYRERVREAGIGLLADEP
jgi:hypothetical protein